MAHYPTSNGKTIHRIVWESQYGVIPKGYHIHHKNENITDNHIDNLELVSSSDHPRIHNKRYKKVHGVWVKHCRYCNKDKPLRMFMKCGHSYTRICRECYPKYERDAYNKNPERYRNYQKKYRENNPDKIKLVNANNYQKHKKELQIKSRERQRRIRAENKIV